jgi:hypothetical protein
VKIRHVRINNRKKGFEIGTWRRSFFFPFGKITPPPDPGDQVLDTTIDEDLAGEAFTFRHASGRQGVVHLEQVLDYHRDPAYLRDMKLYELTLTARSLVDRSPLSRREIIRRLGTSPAQFYRLLDTTNYRKSIDKMLALLHVLDCEVKLVVREPDR